MKWIGLTGGIASGKSTVAQILRQKSVPVIDADQLAHQALAVNKPDLIHMFGPAILGANGDIDRRQLGDIVFSSPQKLKQLEALVHPWVQSQVRQLKQQMQDQGVAMAVYDVPLLFEKGLQEQFDQVVLVYAPRTTMKERLIKRNHLSETEADLRLDRQWDIEDKKNQSDYVIHNEGDFVHLEELVDAWLKTHKLNK
jgi:dephospho-CoA kinase